MNWKDENIKKMLRTETMQKTLPEAQRTQSIESITWVISAAENIANDATSQDPEIWSKF